MIISNLKIQQFFTKFLKYNRLSSSQNGTIDYKNNANDREALQKNIKFLYETIDMVPCVIGSEDLYTGDEQSQKTPHNHKRTFVKLYYGNKYHITAAIKASINAQEAWACVPISEKANIWRKCADIIDKEDRHLLTAAIILGQAKTYIEADKDTTGLIDNLRMTANYLEDISNYKANSDSSDNISILRLRPLDGVVAAIGPFNMTSICCDLAFTPALMGNCVIWKPANDSVYASYIACKAMWKAGLPKGVINFIPANCNLFLQTIATSPHLGGVNFVGRLEALREIFATVGFNIKKYRCFPRIIGESGGKNYHFVHESADPALVIKATTEAAFEYSGQYCTSCSRLYVPASMWSEIGNSLLEAIRSIKIGDPCDFSSYSSAIINEAHFDKIVSYILYADKHQECVEVLCGGEFNKTLGYFIEPTVILCKNPVDRLLNEEILGPVLSIYVYENNCLDEIVSLISKHSTYALVGSIFGKDTDVVCKLLKDLKMASGNIYINKKCTVAKSSLAVYGGNRLSGTNDKLWPEQTLLRWTSPQLIEEQVLKDPE